MIHNPGFKVTVLTNISKLHWSMQLRIIHLLNLQFDVPLTRSPSAIAELLVLKVDRDKSKCLELFCSYSRPMVAY